MINEAPQESLATLPINTAEAITSVESAIETDRERALTKLQEPSPPATSDEIIENLEAAGSNSNFFSFSEYGSDNVWIQSGDDAESVRAEMDENTNSTNEYLTWGRWEGSPPNSQSQTMDTVLGHVTTAARLQDLGPNDPLLGDITYQGNVHG